MKWARIRQTEIILCVQFNLSFLMIDNRNRITRGFIHKTLIQVHISTKFRDHFICLCKSFRKFQKINCDFSIWLQKQFRGGIQKLWSYHWNVFQQRSNSRLYFIKLRCRYLHCLRKGNVEEYGSMEVCQDRCMLFLFRCDGRPSICSIPRYWPMQQYCQYHLDSTWLLSHLLPTIILQLCLLCSWFRQYYQGSRSNMEIYFLFLRSCWYFNGFKNDCSLHYRQKKWINENLHRWNWRFLWSKNMFINWKLPY